MDNLPYVRSVRTLEQPLDAALLLVSPQEQVLLEGLVAQDLKSPVGELEVIPIQDDSSLPDDHHRFEFRLYHTR
jgi:hypothetical protein